jgi:hypothetical protein
VSDIARLAPVKTDVEKAREYRERIGALLQEVCKIVTDARHNGIIINYACASDGLGNQFIASLTTTKELKD